MRDFRFWLLFINPLLCLSKYRHTVLLIFAWHSVCDIMMMASNSTSVSIIIIILPKNLCSRKMVSATKMCWQLWEEDKWGEWLEGSVPRNNEELSSYRRVIVSCRSVVFGLRGLEPCFKNECSISWDDMNKNLNQQEIWFQLCSVALMLEHECSVWHAVHTGDSY